MSTPKDNTEVVRMLREVKNSIWKSVTPMKVNRPFNEYISSLTSSSASISKSLPTVATKLHFSSLDDSQVFPDSSKYSTFKTPDALERKLRNTEVELQTSKAKLTERESYISVMEPANKKLCITLETKLDQYRKQSEFDSQKIEELQAKLKWSKKQTECAKSQIHEIERKKKIELDKMEFKMLALQQECSNLKIEMADIKSEKTETVRKLNVELGRLEMKVSMLTAEVEKSKEYIEDLKRQNTAMAEKVALCNTYQQELTEAEDRIKVLENKIEAGKDAALIVSSRQSDLKLLPDLQKENQLLKEEISNYKENNIALFQEKLWGLEEKLAQAEKKSIALAKTQVENEQLKERISQWEELFDDKSTTYKSPTTFSRRLSEYQKNEIALTNKLSQVSSHCDTLEKQKCDLEESIKSLNNRLQQYQAKTLHQDTLIKRFQRKVIFLTKERDNCRKLLDSYLSESTMTGIALNEAHLSHLEDMNMEYKRALERSEKEVDSLNEKLKNFTENSSSMDILTSEVKKLRDENSLQLTHIAELQKEKLQLENKYVNQNMGQEKSSWDGRILHLKFNPLDNANARYLEAFKKLQDENDHLKKRIKVLEEEGAAADVTMKVQQKLASEGADSTLKTLKEQLASAERQQRFILENARIKSTEFREAVYRLLGYRIDVPTAETYKLSHVYAESRNDYLLFQINSQGIQLIETEYSKQLGDRMQLYLHQHDSFPAFLASLTMDLFSQQTFMIN